LWPAVNQLITGATKTATSPRTATTQAPAEQPAGVNPEPRGRMGSGRRTTSTPRVRPSGLSEGRPSEGRGAAIYASPEQPANTPVRSRQEQEMALLPGGTFRMGSASSAYAAEKPAHDVTIAPFWLDKHEVTNAQFSQFVSETHYTTAAEARGWAPVFDRRTGSWQAVEGACWRHPLGPGSTVYDAEPVVQVSWDDAQAFAAWAGKRLPTEAEWEFAARGGLRDARYPWGNDLTLDRRYQHNFWQGSFPTSDTGADGFRSLAPVGSYAPNRYGLFDMAGNAWEWCGDWFAEDYYGKSPVDGPRGPSRGKQRVQRGGSWLCVDDATAGFLVYSRMAADPDTMYEHVSFRCARDAR
jgi:formylglycine-generating enzyme required for sulfatase activity